MKTTVNIMILAIFFLFISLVIVVAYPDVAEKLSLTFGLASGFLMFIAYLRLTKLSKKR